MAGRQPHLSAHRPFVKPPRRLADPRPTTGPDLFLTSIQPLASSDLSAPIAATIPPAAFTMRRAPWPLLSIPNPETSLLSVLNTPIAPSPASSKASAAPEPFALLTSTTPLACSDRSAPHVPFPKLRAKITKSLNPTSPSPSRSKRASNPVSSRV